MRKILLADDEIMIVRGLRRLIDWASLQTEIVGEAASGDEAARLIEELRPDLVVSDIRMPGLSGLELLERFQGTGAPKFLFISGYEEFEYARRALAGGAVDYLLKPVAAQALEQAVCKALGLMEDRGAGALFQGLSGEAAEFFNRLTANRELAESELYRRFAGLLEAKPNPCFAGLCFGLTPEEDNRLTQLPYERQLLQKFAVFNAVRDSLEQRGQGCFLRKDETRCCLLGVFEQAGQAEPAVQAVLDAIAEKTGFRLRAGIGRPRSVLDQLSDTYEESLRAFDLYYFEQRPIIGWDGPARLPDASNEDFDAAVKRVFQSVVAKRETIWADIDAVLDITASLHYGNRNAALNRTMIFTGDLCQLLFANRLLTGSFAQRQDALQHRLEDCPTFPALRRTLRAYYEELLPDVYRTAQRKNTAEICRVQQYVEEHYHEDLSLKTLAEIACVSPHYFSAYFKAETGQNYKAYLTQVRMERAMHLVMSTSLKTYEIAEQVGYNNVRRFVDAFRTAYQMSPMDYRKLHKKQ